MSSEEKDILRVHFNNNNLDDTNFYEDDPEKISKTFLKRYKQRIYACSMVELLHVRR